MKPTFITSFLLLPTLLLASPAPQPRVKTTSGIAHGLRPDPLVESFLGIPFAHPPTGALRFRAPRRLHSPSKFINATSLGFACYGRSPLPADVPFPILVPKSKYSEDCLNINVYRPTHAGTKKGGKGKGLPVLVWIYGGGFMFGSNSDPLYDGVPLVRNTQNMILVEINYRVALLGFPLTPATPAAETNPGILDQRLGLEWVRDNIAAFGGDPTRMTLFGESAGSSSVDIHTYAYAKDPIVQAYIMQSGQVQLYSGDNVDGDGLGWRQVTDRVGCTDLKDRKKELKCMQSVDAEVLQKVLVDDPLWITGPHTDGIVVFGAKEYERRAKNGIFSKLPTLLGTTHNEADSLNFLDFYNYTASDLLTQSNFNCPASHAASARAAAGVPTWRYRWMGAFPSGRIYPSFRAFHAIDVIWLFSLFRNGLEGVGHVLPEPLPYEIEAEGKTQAIWTGFAVDPKRALRKLGWKEYNPKKETLAELFTPEGTAEINFRAVGGKYDAGCPVW